MAKIRRTKAKVDADAHLRISYHEKICADRMKTLFKRIDDMGKDIKELKTFMNRGKGAGALLFILLSILGSAFYFFKS